MPNKKMYIRLISATVFMLSSVLFATCSTSKSGVEKKTPEPTSTDSVKEFVPLHPPVVVPHSWKDAK